ncbi:hypothetical protein [Psychromonas antarctica]|uniref:hypothetical protein n=1 Tax=Psychromonas antarctica TaxID=67573 RepID=UPI001EE8B906|nr:hypothetical protein [Psychromonas antarctica]MCG6202541.1 hypothetical protein [Psychromonas antarctica]
MLDHGTLKFQLEDDILIIEGRGPWNREAMLLSSENADIVKKQRIKDKWGVIIILYGDPIHTPDAAQLLVEYVKYDKKNGRVATALILNGSKYPELGRRHITDLYNQAGEIAEFFNNITDAKKWMRSLLDSE